jgi:VWFA-related protein
MISGSWNRELERLRSVFLAMAILVLPGLPTLAQDEEIRHHGIFIDSVEVSLVNVDVFVTRGGEPVTNLTAEDFEVLDDGEPVEITHFSRVEGRRPVVGGNPAAEEKSVAASRGLEPRRGSTVVILVDQLFVSPLSRKLVFDRLYEMLQRLTRNGSRVMVASKVREIAVEQPFTTSRADLRLSLDRLAAVVTPNYASEIRLAIENWQIVPDAVESRQSGPGQPPPPLITSELDARAAFQDARTLSQRLHNDVRYSLVVLHRFLDSLAGMPGRKALIYVADRLPVRPGELLWRAWWEKYGFEHGTKLGASSPEMAMAEFDSSRALEELIADANANRVIFYPIGTESGPNLSGAESRSLETQTRAMARTRESRANDGLRSLSERTGGRATLGPGGFGSFFDRLLQDLENYYSLAYPSLHDGDGETHRVEVRVRRPDLEVRHLTEYRDKSSDQRLADRTLAALTFGATENPLGVRVEVGKAKKQKDGHFVVPVDVHVPVANLVLLPGRTHHRGKLSIQLIARSEKGRVSDPVMIRLPFEVPHGGMAGALSQTVDYRAQVTLRGGQQTIAVGVHDDLGSRDSTVGVEAAVGGRG